MNACYPIDLRGVYAYEMRKHMSHKSEKGKILGRNTPRVIFPFTKQLIPSYSTRMLSLAVSLGTLVRFLVILGTYKTSCNLIKLSFGEPFPKIFSVSHHYQLLVNSYHDAQSSFGVFQFDYDYLHCSQSTNYSIVHNFVRLGRYCVHLVCHHLLNGFPQSGFSYL